MKMINNLIVNLSEKLTVKINRQNLKNFLASEATEEEILEIGAKNRPYKDFFPNVIALDIVAGKEINLIADAHLLPFKKNSFSTILCTEVLEHCQAPHQVVNEFYRILKTGGKLILTTSFIFPIHEAPNDYFRFTKYGLKHLCSGFSQVKIRAETDTVSTMAVLMQRLAFQCVWVTKIPLVNVLLHLLAKIVPIFSGLIKKEYGNINRSRVESEIMSSGYYLVAIK